MTKIIKLILVAVIAVLPFYGCENGVSPDGFDNEGLESPEQGPDPGPDNGQDAPNGPHTITFHKSHPNAEGTMDEQAVESDGPVTLASNLFTMEDYEFLGWSITLDESFDPNTFHYDERESAELEVVYADSAEYAVSEGMLGSDTTLYAVWVLRNLEPKPEEFLYYDYNYESGPTPWRKWISDGEGGQVSISGNFSRTAHNLAGWSTTPEGDIEYQPGDVYTHGSSSVTLYAVWNEMEYRDLISIDGGTFLQKAPNESNEFEHTVSDFRMGQYQVTYELWYSVRTWAENNGYNFDMIGQQGRFSDAEGITPIDSGDGDLTARFQPVTKITWRDAIVWANAYSELSELEPVYKYTGEVLKDAEATTSTGNPITWDNVNWVTTNNGYRLPSEGEWHYAASWRGTDGSDDGVIEFPGSSGQFWTPADWASGAKSGSQASTQEVAQTGSTNRTARPVGGKDPNALNVYDMSGNVSEWLWDRTGDYPESAQTDYRGPLSSRLNSMRRGARLRGGPSAVAYQIPGLGSRGSAWSDAHAEYIGFRVARNKQE